MLRPFPSVSAHQFWAGFGTQLKYPLLPPALQLGSRHTSGPSERGGSQPLLLVSGPPLSQPGPAL